MTTEPVELNAKAINNAVKWYRTHKKRVAAALPLTTEGTIYRAGYLLSFERAIASWETGDMGLNLAGAYILYPLRRIKEALKP